MQQNNFVVEAGHQELVLLSSLLQAEAFLRSIGPLLENLGATVLESLVGDQV